MFMPLIINCILVVTCFQLSDEGYRNAAPDFSGERGMWKLLENRGVRIELGLPIDRFREIQKLQADAMKEKNQILAKVGDRNIKLELAIYAEVDKKTSEAVRAILRPDQISRLMQITHHVDIAFNGIGYAFADGNLAELIGITQNQRSGLREKAKKFQASAMRDNANIKSNYRNKVLSALGDMQLTKLKELLGAQFEFDSPSVAWANMQYADALEEVNNRKVNNPQANFAIPSRVIPDFANKAELLGLLHSPSIQLELGLSTAQLTAFNDVIQQAGEKIRKENEAIIAGMNLDDATIKAHIMVKLKEKIARRSIEFAPIIEELLLPGQMVRLVQLGRHVEIAYLGIGGALVSGKLGSEVGISATEKQQLGQLADKSQEVLRLETGRIRNALQEQMINELSTQQANIARDLLGEYFEYDDANLYFAKERKRLLQLKSE